MELFFLYPPIYNNQLLSRTKKLRKFKVQSKFLLLFKFPNFIDESFFNLFFFFLIKSGSYMFVSFLLKIIGIVLYLAIASKRNYSICLFESWNIWASNSCYLLLYYWKRWSAKGTGNLKMVLIIILPTLSESIVVLVFLFS